MAGTPGSNPALGRKALEGGPDRRDPNASALGTIARYADRAGFGDDRRRSRLLAGLASQWYGLDEHGNPSMGETPGIVHETKALGTLPGLLVRAAQNKLASFAGLEEDPAYRAAQEAMFGDPEWATEASTKADQLHEAVREDMGLEAPRGFEENAQESLGVMLGQIPVPSRAKVEAGTGALQKLTDVAEWFTPTVEARARNYGLGAGVGALLGTAADEEELPVVLPGEQPGTWDVRPTYSDGSVGYSVQDEYAGGGKVRPLSEWLELMHRKRVPDAEKLSKLASFDPKLSSDDIEILNRQSHFGSPALSDHEYGQFVDIINEHAVPLPGMRLHRGVRIEPDELDNHLKMSYSDLAYATPSRAHAAGYAIDPAPRTFNEFDSLDGGAHYLLQLKTEPGISRGFVSPFYNIYSQAEVVLPQGTSFERTGDPVRAKLRSDRFRGLFDPDSIDETMKRAIREQFATEGFRVPVKMTWEPEFNGGGQVKDYCSGGMSTVRAMRAKYAGGGRATNALAAIKNAIAHLDNGDTASALRTLRASPEALQDPGIAAAMSKLRSPATARGGRQALDAAVAADSNAKVEATFAEGGKVKSVEAAVRKARTTLAEAKKIVRGHGHTLVKEDGEYIVKKKRERTRIEGDDSHYFTDDIDDAIGTSSQMARERAGLRYNDHGPIKPKR